MRSTKDAFAGLCILTSCYKGCRINTRFAGLPTACLRLDVGSSKACWRQPTCFLGAGYNLARCNLKRHPRGCLFSFCACGAKEFYLTARGHTLPLALPHADLGVSAPARGGCFSLFALWAPHSWPHLRGAAERSEAGGAIAVLSQPPPSFAFGKSHLPQRWRQDMSLFTKGLHNPTISPLARAV